MSTLTQFANVSITSATQMPSRIGFGTPLVLGYFTAWPDRVRTYSSLTAMVADGINSTGVGAATYWAAAAIFSQNPRVKQIKVGRRTNAWTQKVQLFPTSATAGVVYKVTIGALGSSSTAITRTVPGASSIAAECTALKGLIDALGLAMTTALGGGNTYVECTASVPGQMFVFASRNPEMELFESTAAPAAISTDLDACRAADDDFYGVTPDSCSKAEALLIAAWAEPTGIKIFFGQTGDTEDGKIGVASTLLKQLQAAAYFRTAILFDSIAVPSFAGAGWMGKGFPYTPGTITYHAKSLSGVTVDIISETVDGEVKARNGNTYTVVAGTNVTADGKVASGEFIDVVIGRDCLQARIKEAVFGVISGQLRVPFNNGGIQTIVGTAKGVCVRQQGTKENPGFLDPEQAVIVTGPLIGDVDPVDRANRFLRNVTFSAKITGAIHATNISGTISV